MAAVRTGEVSAAGLAAGALCNIAAGSNTAQGSIRAAGGVSALVGLLKRGAALLNPQRAPRSLRNCFVRCNWRIEAPV